MGCNRNLDHVSEKRSASGHLGVFSSHLRYPSRQDITSTIYSFVFMCHSNTISSSEHFPVAPQAIGNLLSVLDHRERCIKHLFTLAVTHIIQSTEYAKQTNVNSHNSLTPIQIYKRPHPQRPQQQFVDCRSNAGCIQ